MSTNAFLLGKAPRTLTNGQSSIGFRQNQSQQQLLRDNFITYSHDRHMAVIAGTGQWKSRSVAITNLLSYTGPTVVLDVKSELYHVTARARRAMGHRVIRLDPALITGDTDALNPFDLFQLAIASVELESQTFAQQLTEGHQSSRDPFWHTTAGALLTGLIIYMVTCLPRDQQTLARLRELLHADDIVYSLASILDSLGKKLNRVAYQEIAALLQMPDQNTRPSVIATAQSLLKTFVGPGVEAATRSTSFSLNDWTAGEPITIYIIIPPYRFEALKGLFKVWITTLAMACMSRTTIPPQPNLFLLDEAATLGPYSYLKQLHSIGRGFGMRLLTCWQSLAQLQANYPNSGWNEILDNCGVLQIFGSSSYLHATDMSRLTGVSPTVFLDMPIHEQLICLDGKTILADKVDYLSEPFFQGLYDPNPFYAQQNQNRQQKNVCAY